MTVSKVFVGWSRGKPIGFLIVLCIVTALIALVFGRSVPPRSRAGDRRLKELHSSHAHLKRAPRQQDLPLAVALTGTAVLAGSAFAAYHAVGHPGSGDGSGGDTGSDDGSGGGNASGCGGCGGD